MCDVDAGCLSFPEYYADYYCAVDSMNQGEYNIERTD